MSSLYVVRNKITTFGVSASGATILAITAPTGRPVRVKKWWADFDGVNAAEKPVFLEVQRASTAPTGTTTSFTPEAVNGNLTAAAASTVLIYNASQTEGSPTMSGGETHLISPTAQMYVQEPLGDEQVISGGGIWRMRATVDQSGTPTAHGVTYGVWIEE